MNFFKWFTKKSTSSELMPLRDSYDSTTPFPSYVSSVNEGFNHLELNGAFNPNDFFTDFIEISSYLKFRKYLQVMIGIDASEEYRYRVAYNSIYPPCVSKEFLINDCKRLIDIVKQDFILISGVWNKMRDAISESQQNSTTDENNLAPAFKLKNPMDTSEADNLEATYRQYKDECIAIMETDIYNIQKYIL